MSGWRAGSGPVVSGRTGLAIGALRGAAMRARGQGWLKTAIFSGAGLLYNSR